jgi:hypothetical protein
MIRTKTIITNATNAIIDSLLVIFMMGKLMLESVAASVITVMMA